MSSKIKVKLCGINDIKVAEYCCNLAYKPDYLGFVFYHDSPRNISYDQAYQFNNIIGNHINKVAVTVNSELSDIEKIITNLNPDYLQLHGDESVEYIKILKQEFNIKIIKAFPIKEDFDSEFINLYQQDIDYFLFDSHTEKYGGSGRNFNWKILSSLSTKKPWFLSGGININNILTAINSVKTNIFDISSGIESQKGVKDLKKIKELLSFIKNFNDSDRK